MSGYAPRRMPSSAGATARQGAAAANKGSSGRNNAARDAQRRLQQMMIGQVDDEYDYDGRDSYQEPVVKPIQASRPRPPPVAPGPRNASYLSQQSVMSPDSGSDIMSSHSHSHGHAAASTASGQQPFRRQLSNSRSTSAQRRYTNREGSDDGTGGGSSREMDQLRRENAKLQDDNDVLEEQNEVLYEKLREAEEHLKESQLRNQELEKQVANLGGGVSIEARLLAKKEAALKQREAALKAATEQSRDVTQTELNNLRLEVEAAQGEAMTANDLARHYESELHILRQMTSKLLLTADQKEEVVMKRCWLARYWQLAKSYDIHADLAVSQTDSWQSFAPLPVETVLAVAQRAREESNWVNRERDRDFSKDSSGPGDDASAPLKSLSTDVNIESMFHVEKALRDLTALRIEEGVLFAMAQHRRPALVRTSSSSGAPSEAPRLQESVELSEEEVEDVQFKQNWLVYFWRRAKSAGIEPDLADEKLQYWIARTNFPPKAHDAVDVERGLLEMRKLGLENQLWAYARSTVAADAAAVRKTAPPSAALAGQEAGSPAAAV